MKYGYINKFTAQPGKSSELKTALLQAATALGSNDDCRQYLISTTQEPEVILVTEIWTSKKAHDASLESEEVRAAISRAMPLIASVSNVAQYQIEGGKGLA